MIVSRESSCSDPEVLAAFVAGNLRDAELRRVTEHLLDCEDCRIIVQQIAYVDREERTDQQKPVAAAPARARPPVWRWAVAASIVMVVGAVTVMRFRAGREEGVGPLVAAMPRDGRTLEPRLSGGFPWAPLRLTTRSPTAADAKQMKVIGAAGVVLEKSTGDPSPRAQHAAAVAHLVIGQTEESVRLLSSAASSNDARTWSDLAAARYTLAVETGDSAQFTAALAAADAALRIDPKLPEALFNRALTLQRLRRAAEAREAWERYVTVDPNGPWSREARQHLQPLAPQR